LHQLGHFILIQDKAIGKWVGTARCLCHPAREANYVRPMQYVDWAQF
jgi:hypothetical protein